MDEKTEKEEAEFKVADLCVNNCSLVGNHSTCNMCQNCFSASGSGALTSAENKFPKSEATISRSAVSEAAITSRSYFSVSEPERLPDSDMVPERADLVLKYVDLTSSAVKEVYRCFGCRKRVGLTGFRCRCGGMFCAKHRFSDGHDCSYDYKSAGREAIARENIVVKAAKIVRF